MQTASKIERDNWNDINNGLIINIRPRGTYIHHRCHCHHHHHPASPYYDPWAYYDIYYPRPHGPKPPRPHRPRPPFPIDDQPMLPPPHIFPVDIDGDGFVENDVILKPYPKPLCPPHHHHHDCFCTPEPADDRRFDPMETKVAKAALNEAIDMSKNSDFEPETVESEVPEVETDTVNDFDTEMINNIQPSVFGSADNNEQLWENSQVFDKEMEQTLLESPIPEPELKPIDSDIIEEVKSTHTRRINRGGRRKKAE